MIESWREELKEGLKDEIRTMVRMVNQLNPKSEAELIAVLLPNLHLFCFNFIASQIAEAEKRGREAFVKAAKDHYWDSIRSDNLLTIEQIEAIAAYLETVRSPQNHEK